MDKDKLIEEEIQRILYEYMQEDLCWDEFSESVHADPRLSLKSQVKVYSRLCKIIDDDNVIRILSSGEKEKIE